MKLKYDSNYITEVSYTKFQQNLPQASEDICRSLAMPIIKEDFTTNLSLWRQRWSFSHTCHEDIWREWRYSSTHSEPQHKMYVSDQPHNMTNLLLGNEPPSIQRIRDGVGPRSGMKHFGNKIYFPCQYLNLRSSSQKPSHYSDYNTLASLKSMYLCNNCVFY
jgi:hypothetical protein